jgi:hypothetical protein
VAGQGRAGADAAFEGEHYAGYLPAVRTGVAAAGRGSVEQSRRNGAVNRDRIETVRGEQHGKSKKRVVARDGVEPPTPAFSGADSTHLSL